MSFERGINLSFFSGERDACSNAVAHRMVLPLRYNTAPPLEISRFSFQGRSLDAINTLMMSTSLEEFLYA